MNRLGGIHMLVFAAALWLTVACGAHHPQPAAPPPYPGEGVAVADITWNALLRQRIVARHGDRIESFEAVLQVHAETLRLLILTPFHSRALLIEQVGKAVSVQRFINFELPFPPHYILLDVHRVFFIAPATEPRPDGIHAFERLGEAIVDTWHAGRLRQRSYQRRDARPAGRILVDYGDGWAPGAPPPPRIRLTSEWWGYALDIETVEYTPLAPAPMAPSPAAPGQVGLDRGPAVDIHAPTTTTGN